jgi:hypothetical protein
MTRAARRGKRRAARFVLGRRDLPRLETSPNAPFGVFFGISNNTDRLQGIGNAQKLAGHLAQANVVEHCKIKRGACLA